MGPRVAELDYGDCATHVDQAATFTALFAPLFWTLMAFWRDLGPHQQNVSEVVQSEFGRRLQGKSGRFLDRWPGLANATLDEGANLSVATEFRAVLTGMLQGHVGI